MTHHTDAERALANLRHLYTQMVFGTVSNTDQAKRIAEGLLSPAIALLERAPAVQVSRFNHAAKRKLEMLIESGESITGYAFQNKDGRRGSIDCHGFVYWWQDAAAPVPQGWKLVPVDLLERIQESLGSFVSDQGWSQSDMDTADALDGLLAAAPQPPEATVKQQLTVEAAPVQLPEPAAWRDPKNFLPSQGCTYEKSTAKKWAHIYTEALYTEQQVRQLLANHGIK